MANITFRADDETSRALAELTRDGRDRSTVIREALASAAREQRTARLRSEAESVAADAEDRAEMVRVLADMEQFRAW